MNRRSGRIARRRRTVTVGESSRAVVDRLEPRAYLSVSFGGPDFFSGVASGVSIASGDFNGDGKPDVVVAGFSPTISTVPVLGVYLNSAGTFGKPTVLPFNGAPGPVAVGDFTNDGKTDIALIDAANNELTIFVGDGAGNFSPGVGGGFQGQGGATSLAVADFNGDHLDDIAAAEPTQNQVEIQFSKGNTSFAAESTISVPDPKKVIAADVNGDGHPDLVIASGNGSVYIAINTGTGTFATPLIYNIGPTLTSINDLAVADINGDGQPDLIVAGDTGVSGSTTGAVAILLNQGGGSGTFGAARATATVIDPIDILAGKFTGTANVDLGILSASGAMIVLPGNGDGTLGTPVPIFSTQLVPPLGPAVAADFNGDALSDFAFVSQSQMGLGVAPNITNGTIVNPPPPPPTSTTSPLVPTLAGKLPATSLVAGGKITPIHEIVTLTNSSAATISGAVTLSLVLATTPAGETGDPIVATLGKNVSIKAHKSKTFAVLVKNLPAGNLGAHYILAEVTDPTKLTNTGATAATISIVAPTIDLNGAFVAPPTKAKIGRNAGITFSVTNSGTIAASGMLPIQIQASTTAGVDSTSAVIDMLTKKVSIKPGKTIRIHVSKSITATAGSYYLIVQLDPGNMLGDVNTANNTFVTGAPIVVS